MLQCELRYSGQTSPLPDPAGQLRATTASRMAGMRSRCARAEPGKLFPVEDEETGRELMRQTSAAILLGVATAKAPELAPLAVAATPLASAVATAIGRIGRRRVENAAETLADAVEASGAAPEEFIHEATADDRRMELLTRTMVIAQDTALRRKRRALGRALAAGVAGDDARIDEELLFLRAVADVDTPHIKLLARMTEGPPMHPAFPRGIGAGRRSCPRCRS
jgi:hypothetical protein